MWYSVFRNPGKNWYILPLNTLNIIPFKSLLGKQSWLLIIMCRYLVVMLWLGNKKHIIRFIEYDVIYYYYNQFCDLRCGNVNWARRNQCNVCNRQKFSKIEARTGMLIHSKIISTMHVFLNNFICWIIQLIMKHSYNYITITCYEGSGVTLLTYKDHRLCD